MVGCRIRGITQGDVDSLREEDVSAFWTGGGIATANVYRTHFASEKVAVEYQQNMHTRNDRKKATV